MGPLLIGVPALVLVRAYVRGAIMATGLVAPLSVGVAAHAAALTSVMAALPFTALPGVACAGLAISAGLLAEVAVCGPTGRGGARWTPHQPNDRRTDERRPLLIRRCR